MESYMKVIISTLILLSLQSCSLFTKYQTPFSVEDPSIKGEKLFAKGSMISSSKQRYWLSYRYALEGGGYTVVDDDKFPFFKTTGLTAIAENTEANFKFWKEGQAYSKSLCSDFFRRISLAKAHREHAKKQTNIIGGLVTAGMGFASSSAEAVGATGMAFSGAGSGFDAYDSTYLVTPDLGLMESLVKAVQSKKSSEVTADQLMHVSDAINHLNDFVYPCTFTGMQALLDNSLNKKISDFPTHAPFNP